MMSDFILKLILGVSVAGCLGAVSALCDVGVRSLLKKRAEETNKKA